SLAAIEFAECYADVGLSRRKGRPSVLRAATDAWRAAEINTRNTSNSVEYATRMIPLNAAYGAAATLQSEGWLAADFASGFSAQPVAWICAGRQLIAHVLPTADRSVSLVANRQLIAPLPGGQACPPRAPGRRFPRPVRVTSVGNRQRPHHGGT